MAAFLLRLHRLARRLKTKGGVWTRMLPLVRRVGLVMYSCDISPTAKIGRDLFLPHPIGIVIGRGVCIGDRVTLMQHVTLGQRRRLPDDLSDYPIIEDDVVIGAGAVVLGSVRIGKGAKIGANAVVLIDVPAGASAAGVPAKTLEFHTSKTVC